MREFEEAKYNCFTKWAFEKNDEKVKTNCKLEFENVNANFNTGLQDILTKDCFIKTK